MSKSVEVQAKTIEAAIEQALEQLGASYDEVDVEILSEAGFLKKAKVLVTKKEAEKMVDAEKEIVASKKQDTVALQQKVNDKENSDNSINAQKGKESKEKSARKETESKSEKKNITGETVNKEKSVVNVGTSDLSPKFKKTLDFVNKLLHLMDNDSTVTYEVTERSFNININGENVGGIIGKGGNVLYALQTIISSIAIANSGGEQRRVYLNIENYKERRIETLKELALKKAERVKESGRYIKLEPMNARERAVIHSALQEVEGVRTYSTGKDPHRCLCIAPKQD